jgi:TPR repeat protein
MTANEFSRKHASAQRGNVKAMYELALAYKRGDGVDKNAEQFFHWMRKAALAGQRDAMLDLAFAYEDGEGVDPDINLSFEWKKKAAELSKDSEAIYNLALAYKDGNGTGKNHEQFFEWITKAAELKHPEAMYHLAQAYEEGIGTEQNLLRYFEWTKKIADIGNAGAMRRLADAYNTGKGVPPSSKEFYQWTRKAERAAERAANEPELAETEKSAFEDLPWARYSLALAYRDGTGTNRNKRRYFEWMKKSAEAVEDAVQQARKQVTAGFREDELKAYDFPKSMLELARAYRDGDGTRRSKKLYQTWIKKAAEFGLPEAMVELALAYREGKNIDQDISKFGEWVEKAARAGNSEGMYHLALAHGSGVGKRYDKGQFLKWIKEAVKENHRDAFIAQGIAELQQIGLIGKKFEDFFELLMKLHSEVQNIQEKHVVNENGRGADTKVAHYTVLPALYSMLPETPTEGRKANCLRLYNIAYVNDPREGKRLLSPAKDADSPLKNSEHLKEFFPEESEGKPDYPIPWQGQKFSVYVGSFTLEPDRLDLWRAYGKDGEGYCIVLPLNAFNQEPLTGGIHLMQSDLGTHASRTPETEEGVPNLYEVYYTEDKAEEALSSLAGSLINIKEARDAMIKASRIPSKSKCSGKELINSLVRAIVSGVLYLYKDKEYENEREARILMGFDINAKRLKLETAAERKAPQHVYVETKGFLFEKDHSQIIIGPKVAEKAAVYLNIQKRLACNNLSKTEIKISEITYR